MGETTSWTLIGGAASGDATSRGTFARLYGDVVRIELAARMRRAADDADVEDAVQEVMLECLKAGGALERASAKKCTRFRAYLGGITRNVALRYQERQMLQPDTLDRADTVSDPGPAIAARLDAAWSHAVLGEVMALLVHESATSATARMRLAVLRMRHEEGSSPAEIAAALNITPVRVHYLTAEAKRDFRNALLSVVSQQNPGLTRAEVEAECVALLRDGMKSAPRVQSE